MNLPILLFFGIVCTACAIYKIPDYDACVLKVLLCDDFTKPLTPIDNSTLEMFESIGQLNGVCDELSKFRICLKNAEKFCKENAKLDVGFELLNNRRLAFDLCVRGSAHQHVYMMVEGCVNKYSHSAIEFCTDKAVETVGLDFDLQDYECECRFLGAMQHCHIAVVTDQCGGIAGNMLEKLVVFRGERDFMCIGYEKEKLKNLEAFYATMDSYVQQYRNIVDQNETEDIAERIDGVKNFKTPPQEASSQFHSRISPITDEDLASDNEYTSNRGQSFNLETSCCPENQPLCSCLSDNEILDSEHAFQNTAQHTRRFYEQRTRKVVSDENYACKTKASFLLMGIRPNGEHYQLGYGFADVLWATFYPLKDVSCAWVVNPSAPMSLHKCSILIDNSLVALKGCKRKMECVFPFNATIAVYETVNEREAKRVAELRVHSFLKYSSTLEGRLDYMINFFKNHAHDIRFWCTEQRDANLYKEPNRAHSTSRIGFIPYDVHKYGMVSGQSRISDQKYNFYKPEQSEYPIDTEIHLISSGEGSLENEFEVGDSYASQNYDETLNPLLSDEMFSEKNYDGPSIPRPSTPPKSSSHSYRPYDLYRPRVGETLEAEHHDMSSENLGIKDAEESSFNPNVVSFEDATKNGYTSHLYAEEMCPVLPENISKLINKPGRYSRVNYMNIADPLDIVESKRYKKFSISKTGKDIPLSNVIWKAEDPENIATDNKQNKNEEIYIVTPSTEIETSSVPSWTVSEEADIQNLDDNSRILNEAEDSQDFVEVPQERNSKDLTLEKDFITKSINAESSREGFLELISNYQNEHPFSDKFIDASTNHEVVFEEEQFSPKSEMKFSRRLGQKYATEIEKLLNVYEVLTKVEIRMKGIIKILKEMPMKKNNKSLRKIEL
ncbi:hypothetical protein AVEN_126952-1 [Araneus ventricosus]|uniref:Uncharacterized protein n=1 Tax=Araneus ventricosus TaxID=182803 RepID=A0A4Y2EC13_ARAVE|nr:hypothetical protein AVEN_126952-1 [Araneus ventricosus]